MEISSEFDKILFKINSSKVQTEKKVLWEKNRLQLHYARSLSTGFVHMTSLVCSVEVAGANIICTFWQWSSTFRTSISRQNIIVSTIFLHTMIVLNSLMSLLGFCGNENPSRAIHSSPQLLKIGLLLRLVCRAWKQKCVHLGHWVVLLHKETGFSWGFRLTPR